MSFLDQITCFLAAACRAGTACVSSTVVKTAKRVGLTTWLLAIATILLLGSLGLMIAALFIGLTPHLGAHWAAMIAAAAALAGSGIFMAIARTVSKSR